MSGKILYCATVDYHFKAFHLPYMKHFKERGWIVDIAASGNNYLPYTDHKYNIPIHRSPFHLSNVKAFQQLVKIINQNHYSIIHCHTPLGGVLARLAARKARRQGTKLIYTAHGFHFYQGASLLNWLLYYPIEKFLANVTDCLITINEEDYRLATSHNFKAKAIEHVHGVGVDTGMFKPLSEIEKAVRRKSFGYGPNDFLLIYAAEFNKNKNQRFLLESLVLLQKQLPNARLLLAGDGPCLESCKKLAERLGVTQMVEFLGFRSDLDQLLPICDVAVASSFREGLPVNVMEAMASGLPVVAVDNRGHRELIENGRTGWTLDNWDASTFANKLLYLAQHVHMKEQFGKNAREIILKKYSTNKVSLEKMQIYESFMEEGVREKWLVQ